LEADGLVLPLTERRLHEISSDTAKILRPSLAASAAAYSSSTQHRTERSMNLIIWLVVGGLIGWVASMIMKTNAQQGILLNVVVGIVGAFLGGWFLSPLLGAGTINQNDFSVTGLGVSLLGAIILLAIVNLVRRGTAR
jgi:uncharacterized membrane protein YeaQ/YmgE (transglycosylase-associated protein family)